MLFRIFVVPLMMCAVLLSAVATATENIPVERETRTDQVAAEVAALKAESSKMQNDLAVLTKDMKDFASRVDSSLGSNLHGSVEQISTKVDALKPEKDSLSVAGIAAAAGLFGAVLGAFGTVYAAKESAKAAAKQSAADRDAESLRERDQALLEVRARAYGALFKYFNDFPEIPVAPKKRIELDALLSALKSWYYDTGGGLVMSDLTKKVFDACRTLVDNASTLGSKNDDLTEEIKTSSSNKCYKPYDALFYVCSKLRTSCIRDVDGRREVGTTSQDLSKDELQKFIEEVKETERSAMPELLEKFARQQRQTQLAPK